MPDDVDTLVTKAAIAQAEGDLPRAAALLAPLHPRPTLGAVGNKSLPGDPGAPPAQIISRLKEILAKPDPALGYFNGDLRFWLGWAQEVAGDHAAAQESWRQARSELESFLKEQPDNYTLIGDLALTNMGLGDKAAALALAERAIATNPNREGRDNWSHSDRDPRKGGGTHGRARPRHRSVTETTLYTVRWRAGCRHAAYSRAPPARSNV